MDNRAARLQEIGLRIRHRREGLMTQEELAAKAQLSKSRISEIEKGSSAANGLAYLAIAEALEVPVEWLLTGEGPSVRKPAPPPISSVLSDLAEKEGWSHKLTVEIATAISAVHARRTAGGRPPEYSREQILKLADALKEQPDP